MNVSMNIGEETANFNEIYVLARSEDLRCLSNDKVKLSYFTHSRSTDIPNLLDPKIQDTYYQCKDAYDFVEPHEKRRYNPKQQRQSMRKRNRLSRSGYLDKNVGDEMRSILNAELDSKLKHESDDESTTAKNMSDTTGNGDGSSSGSENECDLVLPLNLIRENIKFLSNFDSVDYQEQRLRRQQLPNFLLAQQSKLTTSHDRKQYKTISITNHTHRKNIGAKNETKTKGTTKTKPATVTLQDDCDNNVIGFRPDSMATTITNSHKESIDSGKRQLSYSIPLPPSQSIKNPVQITSIDGFFNRKRGRPPKNRFVEVYKNTQQSPQAIFTSFKLQKQNSDQIVFANEKSHHGQNGQPFRQDDQKTMQKKQHIESIVAKQQFRSESGNATEHQTTMPRSFSENIKDLCTAPTEDNFEKVSVVRASGTFFPDKTDSNSSFNWQMMHATQKPSSTIQDKMKHQKFNSLFVERNSTPMKNHFEREKFDSPGTFDESELPEDLSINIRMDIKENDRNEQSANIEKVLCPEDNLMHTYGRNSEHLNLHIQQLLHFYQEQHQHQQQQFLCNNVLSSAFALSALTKSQFLLNTTPMASSNCQTLDEMNSFFKTISTAVGAAIQPKNPNKCAELHKLKEDKVPTGYTKFRFNEDCGFSHCNYRKHQSHFHCNRNNCFYSFCDKTRHATHSARHDRLDSLMGNDFQQYRANMNCGFANCIYVSDCETNAKKSSHFHCRNCDFICSDTNKVVAHRRFHAKMEYIRMAGFRKIASNENCIIFSKQRYCEQLSKDDESADKHKADLSKCQYCMKHTHYHCLFCGGSVLSRSQLAIHKHRKATNTLSSEAAVPIVVTSPIMPKTSTLEHT